MPTKRTNEPSGSEDPAPIDETDPLDWPIFDGPGTAVEKNEVRSAVARRTDDW